MNTQRCPACAVVEAAGTCCTACLTPTGVGAAHRRPPARRGATQRPAPPPTGPEVHPDPQRAAAAVQPASGGALAGLWSETELRAAWGDR